MPLLAAVRMQRTVQRRGIRVFETQEFPLKSTAGGASFETVSEYVGQRTRLLAQQVGSRIVD